MAQKQTSKPSTKETEAPERKSKDVKNEELDTSTEDLLDEIESVLEKDAEAFVKNYVQRGGQ